jgi:DNA repair exonuclease SbcCD nuclease subunit
MKLALFTDIHWGCKNNSIQHNEDCTEYIQWFVEQMRREKCTAIAFLGDWFENRNAINVQTLNYSFRALKALDDLGLPIYFCVGNHDLYHRGNRENFSTFHFSQFKNVTLVNDFTFVDEMLFAPFLFKDEYPKMATLVAERKPKYVLGHFEFRNFVVTGTDRRIEHGPDHTQFAGPKYIFSGHFHKRQVQDNIVYIGNTFPTNYGDAWDDERGMCILDAESANVEFINWEDCPKYRKVKLSDVLSGEIDLTTVQKCRVRCVVDVDIAYSDAQALKDEMVKTLGLREFSLEENLAERKDMIAGQDGEIEFDFASLNEAVISMLKSGVTGTATIDPEKLVEIYSSL